MMMMVVMMMMIVVIVMVMMVTHLVRAWYSLFPSGGQTGPELSSKV